MKIQIFDPPMCCSTGVCGPSVDPELVRFAADLDWLKRQSVEVIPKKAAAAPCCCGPSSSQSTTGSKKKGTGCC